ESSLPRLMAESEATRETAADTCTCDWSSRSISAVTVLSPEFSGTDAFQVRNPSELVAATPFTVTLATFFPSVVPRAETVAAVGAPEIENPRRSIAGGAGGAPVGGGPSTAGGTSWTEASI